MKIFYKKPAAADKAVPKQELTKLQSFAALLTVVLTGATFTAQAQFVNGTSGFPTVANAGRVVVADFDGDGDEDILYQNGTTAGAPFNYSRNNGDGSFTSLSLSASPFAGITLPDMSTAALYEVKDFDNDGDLDVWVPVLNSTGRYFRKDTGGYSEQSSGSFPTVTSNTSRAVAGDFDGDGDADILYQTGTAAGSPINYYRNNGNATFTQIALSASPFASVTLADMAVINPYRIADFDGDGDQDIWATANASTGKYYRNDNGTYSEQSTGTFPGAQFPIRSIEGDFDADGDADILYQTTGNGSAFQYARSNGNGTFTIVAQSASPFAAVTLPDLALAGTYQVSDFDRDGDQDVWVVSTTSSGTYLIQSGTPPSIVSTSPANNAGGVPVTANIVLTFSEIVNKNTGNIRIVRVSDNSVQQTISVTSSDVTGGGTSAITVNPPADLQASTTYAVTIDADAFADAGGAVFAGITNTTTLRFTTAALPPVLTSTLPANNAGAVGTGTNIVLTFSEAVTTNAGNIRIVRVSDGSVQQTISVTGGSVTGSGTSTITIDPPANLTSLTTFAVQIDNGAFVGLSAYGGINDNTTFRFTTSATLPAKWTGISATAAAGTIRVAWSTTGEINTNRYEVQRSVNGVNFSTVGSTPTANTPGDHRYAFDDAAASAGTRYYYRIKLLDVDGVPSYSATVSAALADKSADGLTVYGGADGSLQVSFFASRAGKAVMQLISVTGQVAARQEIGLQAGYNRFAVPGSHAAAGTYVLQVVTAEGAYQRQLVK